MEETATLRGSEDRPVERGSILFTCRDNLHLTKTAVESARQQDIPCDILIVDNASTDGTKQWLVGQHVAVISLPVQESLAACWNLGLQALFQAGRSHVLVCNTDIELRPDAYRLLLAHGGPFVSCVSVDSSDRLGTPGDREAREDLGERPHPDFSCFLIRPEVTDKVGWFNETYYPAFVEDCEMHVRMHRAGVPAVCIDVPFLHHGSATIKNASMSERNMIARGAAANREKFRREYGCLPGTPEYQDLFR
jgi:GT2 family glycosyltransferase